MLPEEEMPFPGSTGEESPQAEDTRFGCDVKYCSKQENTKRSNWLLNGHSTIALIGITSQTGIIYRFPYLFYRYGPAYLVLYILGVAVVGFPLLYLELTLGQFSSSGVLTCWPLPIFKGVGAGMISYGIPIALEYGTFGAWSMYYLFETMRSSARSRPLPWSSRQSVLSDAPECQDNLHWVKLYEYNYVSNCTDQPGSEAEGGVCWVPYDYNYYNPHFYTNHDTDQGDTNQPRPERRAVGVYDRDIAAQAYIREPNGPLSEMFWTKRPASVYFECHVLKEPLARPAPTSFSTGITVCSLIVWLLVTISSIFGVKSIGPVVNVTVPLAILLLLVLMVRAVSLDGSQDGISYLWHSNWNQLSDWKIWFDVLIDVIFSLCCGCGLVLTFGSYNRFHNGYVRDAAIMCVCAVLIRIVAAVAVMGFVGFWAKQQDLAINDVVTSGVDLEFVALPRIFDDLPVAGAWCGLLFTVVLLATFHSMIAYIEMFVSAILDQLPRLRRLRYAVVLLCGLVAFLLSLPMCTSDGRQLLFLIDLNVSMCQPFLIVILMIFCYTIYGVMTYFAYRHDVAAMTGFDCCCSPSIVCWMYSTCGGLALTIFLMVFVIAYNVVTTSSFTEFTENLPDWLTAGFEKTIQVYTAIVIIIVFLLQLAVALIWKKPSVGKLFRRIWRPALGHHEAIVRTYRANNKYSSQQYGHTPEVYPTSTTCDQRPQTPPPPYPGQPTDTKL